MANEKYELDPSKRVLIVTNAAGQGLNNLLNKIFGANHAVNAIQNFA